MNKINLPDNAIIQALEVSFDGLHILDKHGNTLYINDACTRIEGTSKEEVQSKNIRQLIAEGVYSQSVTLMVLEKKASVTITQTTLNGKEILCTGTPVFDDDGEVEIVIVNSRDYFNSRLCMRGNVQKCVHVRHGNISIHASA